MASCGLDNEYGHPHQEAVERFEADQDLCRGASSPAPSRL